MGNFFGTFPQDRGRAGLKPIGCKLLGDTILLREKHNIAHFRGQIAAYLWGVRALTGEIIANLDDKSSPFPVAHCALSFCNQVISDSLKKEREEEKVERPIQFGWAGVRS